MYRANGQNANNILSHQQRQTKKPLVTIIYQIMNLKKKVIMNLIDKWNEMKKEKPFFKMKDENKMMEKKIRRKKYEKARKQGQTSYILYIFLQ
jgi:hypothetical protein